MPLTPQKILDTLFKHFAKVELRKGRLIYRLKDSQDIVIGLQRRGETLQQTFARYAENVEKKAAQEASSPQSQDIDHRFIWAETIEHQPSQLYNSVTEAVADAKTDGVEHFIVAHVYEPEPKNVKLYDDAFTHLEAMSENFGEMGYDIDYDCFELEDGAQKALVKMLNKWARKYISINCGHCIGEVVAELTREPDGSWTVAVYG